MKNVLFATMIAVLPIFAKDKIAQARKVEKRELTPGSVRKIFASLPDKELIPELTDLEVNGNSMDPREKELLFRHGTEREFVERGRKNKVFGENLVKTLDSPSTTPRIKNGIVKNIWKFRNDPGTLEQDEEALRRYFRNNPADKSARGAVIKQINSSSDANVDFLVEISEKTNEPAELLQSVNRLGRIGGKAAKEKRDKVEARVRGHLVKLRKEKRIPLAYLSGAPLFADKAEGRAYVAEELEKDGFAEWVAVLHPIQDSLGYEYLRKLYRHEKGADAAPETREHLGRLAQGSLRSISETQGFADRQAKLDFLDLYGLANGQGGRPSTDAAVKKLIEDADDDIRYSAVVAAHLGLKGHFDMLSDLYKRESNPKIRNFLHTYGYGE